MQPSTPNRPRQPPPQQITSPHAISARVRAGGGGGGSSLAHSYTTSDQSPRESVSLPALSRLRVEFPDARETNIVRRNLEIVMSELQEVETLQASDHEKLRLQLDHLSALSNALEQQMTKPVALLSQKEGAAHNQSVQVAQREANRLAVEDEWMLQMTPAFGQDGHITAVAPNQEVVRDEPGEKKIRLLTDMLTHTAAEVTRLREELALADAKLARKDDRIIDLESTVHCTTLSMTAMELAMTKLRRKAAVGGGGGGGAGLRVHAAPAAVPGTSASTSAAPGVSSNAATDLPSLAPSTGLTGDLKADRVALSRRSIGADRKRCLIDTPAALQVEALGQDFGPRGRIGLVVVRIPHFKTLAERYPEAANQTLDTLRDAVRGMLEVCDGFEFRQMVDMFACAFDDCNSAVDFGLSLTSHLHNSATWAKEVSLLEQFKTVHNENGMTLFHGLRASIGVHTGFWSGPVDLLCQRKMYSGDLFDRAVIACKSCPAGLMFVTNDVLSATGMREHLAEKVAAVTAIPPWGVHIVLPSMLRDRVSIAAATPDAPLSKSDWSTLLAVNIAPLPAVPKTVVCCQVEGFLNALIDGEIPVRDLYHATSMLKQHIENQLFWSNQRSSELPVIVRQEGEDKLIVLFDSPLDAFDFATSLQEDAMLLPWPESILEAGIGITERHDLPESHRLSLTASNLSSVTTFRGLRVQVGIHICKCANSKTTDWFNSVPRWDIAEVNVAIGLSHAARGGETLASISAREALMEEQRRVKSDRRLAQAIVFRMGKRVAVPDISDPFDAYYVATHTTAYRFRDAFPEQSLDGVCRLAQYGAFVAPSGGSCGIVSVAISHGTFLNSTDGAGYKAACEGLHRVFSMCLRRFGGIDGVMSEEHASLPLSQLPMILFVFPDVRRAAGAALLLHQEALRVPLAEVLCGTPYSHSKQSTNNTPLYCGLRLKMGLHVGRAIIARSPPQVSRAVIIGSEVRKAAVLCLKAQAGLTLCSPVAASRISPILQRLSAIPPCLHELLDFPIEGIVKKRNAQLLLPLSLKERITSTPPDGVDTMNAQIAAALRLYDRAHSAAPTTVAASGAAEAPLPSPTAAAKQHVTKPPNFDAEACIISSAPQMFVVCRIPNVTPYVERSGQFGKDMIKTYLTCARELLGPLHGKELDCDGEALLLSFESAASAVQWSQQMQVSLTCAKWPVEVLSSDFCREVRSTTKSGGAGRSGSLFRGPRALISMEWGTPKRCFDDAKLVWRYFGDAIQFAIELSHWGHGGMIVMSKRAKAVVVQELTQEATRQMLESPNIVALGNRGVKIPSAPSNAPAAPNILERSMLGGSVSSIGAESTSALLGSNVSLAATVPEAPPQLEALFSLIPLVFFERTYPPFPDAASEERRFSSLVDKMMSYEIPQTNVGVHCMMVHLPSLFHAAEVLANVDAIISTSSTDAQRKATTSPTSSAVATRATSPVSDTNEESSAMVAPGPSPVTAITEEHLLGIHPFLFYFGGRIARATKLGAVLQFPRLVNALAFCLSVPTNASAPIWAADCAFALDDDNATLEPLANLITPFGVPGAVTLSEELLMTITQQQSAALFRGQTVGWHRVLDAIPSDELEAPPLRLVSLCALRSTRVVCEDFYPGPTACLGSAATANVDDRLQGPSTTMDTDMRLLQIPKDFWKKPAPPVAAVRRTSTTKTRKIIKDGDSATFTPGPDTAAKPGEGEQPPCPEAGGQDDGGDDAHEQDITAPFEKDARDDSFMAAMTALDPDGGSESALILKDLWDQNRQEAVEDQRRVQLLEAKVADLTEALERHESNQKLSSEVMLRSHRMMRQYRTKLDSFFKKAMIEEVVYGNDADIFVADWVASMKAIMGAGAGEAGPASTGGGGRKTKASLMLSPREEFGGMIRQAIDDDGGESRANPTRLYASLVGHLARVFNGIERLLKQRDRMSRLGGGLHRNKSVRFPSAPPAAATGTATGPTDALGGRRLSTSETTRGLSPDDRKKSMKSKMRSVLALSVGKKGDEESAAPQVPS